MSVCVFVVGERDVDVFVFAMSLREFSTCICLLCMCERCLLHSLSERGVCVYVCVVSVRDVYVYACVVSVREFSTYMCVLCMGEMSTS